MCLTALLTEDLPVEIMASSRQLLLFFLAWLANGAAEDASRPHVHTGKFRKYSPGSPQSAGLRLTKAARSKLLQSTKPKSSVTALPVSPTSPKGTMRCTSIQIVRASQKAIWDTLLDYPRTPEFVGGLSKVEPYRRRPTVTGGNVVSARYTLSIGFYTVKYFIEHKYEPLQKSMVWCGPGGTNTLRKRKSAAEPLTDCSGVRAASQAPGLLAPLGRLRLGRLLARGAGRPGAVHRLLHAGQPAARVDPQAAQEDVHHRRDAGLHGQARARVPSDDAKERTGRLARRAGAAPRPAAVERLISSRLGVGVDTFARPPPNRNPQARPTSLHSSLLQGASNCPLPVASLLERRAVAQPRSTCSTSSPSGQR